MQPLNCHICGEKLDSKESFEDNRDVCKTCESHKALNEIESYCLECNSNDPILIAEVLMSMKSVHMQGSEHHFIVPAALLTAYYNHKGKSKEKAEKLLLAKGRTQNIKGEFCGLFGTCGAAIGTGVFMGLIMEAGPENNSAWKECNQVTGQSLLKVASFKGNSCCKRDTFLSIEETVNYLKSEMGTILPIKYAFCNFSDTNEACIGDACKYNDEQLYICKLPHLKKQS